MARKSKNNRVFIVGYSDNLTGYSVIYSHVVANSAQNAADRIREVQEAVGGVNTNVVHVAEKCNDWN